MGSLGRKIRRQNERKAKKQLKKIASLYLDLPDNCLTCSKPFDKTSKEHVSTWSVVVRKSENKTNLYCPECWANAKKLLADIQKDISQKQESE
tara:strand:- start:1152 stop:1430 length:279 start_codon:yes stop_codon:yes gene_type:complete